MNVAVENVAELVEVQGGSCEEFEKVSCYAEDGEEGEGESGYEQSKLEAGTHWGERRLVVILLGVGTPSWMIIIQIMVR